MSRRVTFLLGANKKDLEKGLKSAERSVQRFGRNIQNLGRTVSTYLTAPLAGLGAVALKEFSALEGQMMSLQNALIVNGRLVEPMMERYKAFANEIQRTTTTSAGATMGMLQVAESMDITGTAAQRVVQNAIALEGAFGIASSRAIRYAADLESGSATGLNRYIPTLKGIEDSTLAAAKANEILGRSFELTQRNTATTSGTFQQARNALNDLLASFGEIISEAILPYVRYAQHLAERFQALDHGTKKMIVRNAALAAAIGPVLLIGGKIVTVFGKLIGYIRPLIGLITSLGRVFLLLLSPLALKLAAVGALVLIVKSIYDTWEPVAEFFRKLWGQITDAFWTAVNWIRDTWNKLRNFIADVVPGITKVVIDEFDKMNEAAGGKIGEFAGNVKDNFMAALGYVKDFATGASSLISGFIPDMSQFQMGPRSQGRDQSPISMVDPLGSVEAGTQISDRIKAYTRNLQELNAERRKAIDLTTQSTLVLFQMSNALEGQITDSIVGFADTLANAFTGDSGMKGFFNGMLMIVTDFTRRFGQLLIAAGTAAIAFNNLLLNPFAAIAAGTALVVLSGAINSLLKAGPAGAAQMATGGIVPGGFPNDTYPALLSSGETVIPAPHKLPSAFNPFGGGGSQGAKLHLVIEGGIRGRDIAFAYDEYKRLNP